MTNSQGATDPILEAQLQYDSRVTSRGRNGWLIVSHARERAEQMGLAEGDVLSTVRDPLLDYPSSTNGHQPGRRIAVRGDLAVVYEPEQRVVITILWHGRRDRADRPRSRQRRGS